MSNTVSFFIPILLLIIILKYFKYVIELPSCKIADAIEFKSTTRMAKLSAQWHQSWFLTLPIYWASERLCSRKFIQTFNFMMGSCIVTYKSAVRISSCNLIAVQGVNMVQSHVQSPVTLLMSTAPHIREAAPTQAHCSEACESSWRAAEQWSRQDASEFTIWPCQKGNRMIVHVYRCQKWKKMEKR